MTPLIIAGLAALGYMGYQVFTHRAKFTGALAQKGDEVEVPIALLAKYNTQLPELPPNTLSVLVQVKGADDTNLQGPVVAFVHPSGAAAARAPIPLGSFLVPRTAVTKIIRGSKVIMKTAGGIFSGEGFNHYIDECKG